MLVSRRAPVLEALGQRLAAEHGIAFRTLALDLSGEGAAKAMLDATADLDVGLYVSNAGVTGPVEKFLDNSVEDARTALRLNSDTLVEAMHGFGIRLRRRGRGGIVVMSSLTALGGRPLFAMYAATKAFGALLAESLWAELRDENIDVIGVIAPGMDTPTTRRTRGDDRITAHHQLPVDIVRKTFETLGRQALVYFPLSHEVEKYAAIEADRNRELEAATAWALAYQSEFIRPAQAQE
jgi:short-subunit dehydrogenase